MKENYKIGKIYALLHAENYLCTIQEIKNCTLLPVAACDDFNKWGSKYNRYAGVSSC